MIQIIPITDKTESEISIPVLAPFFAKMPQVDLDRAGFSRGLCDETRTRLLCLSIDAYEGEPSHWVRNAIIAIGIAALPICAFALGMKVMLP